LSQAAPTEPELAVLWRQFAADLAAVAPLRVDPDDAADIIWATNAPELYLLLVGQLGDVVARFDRAWTR
jgi:hypothetical protein